MSQANVYTGALTNVVWYTDKAEIVTGGNPATYQIYNANVKSIIIGGYISNTSNALSTTLFTTANIVNANIVQTTGIANGNYTVSSLTTAANSAITSITMNHLATANSGNSDSYVQFTLNLPPAGNMYGNSVPQVATNSRQQIYVGAGNYLTVALVGGGSNCTTRELGTASSANAGF